MKTKKTKLKFGVKEPYKRKITYPNSLSYIREQIDRPIPDSAKELSEQTTTNLHLQKYLYEEKY